MKTQNILILIFIISIFQLGCSSPSGKGKNAGDVFCDCMNGKRAPNQSVSVLFAERDSCESLATKQLKTAEDQLMLRNYPKLIKPIKTQLRKFMLTTTMTYQKQLRKLFPSQLGSGKEQRAWITIFSHLLQI